MQLNDALRLIADRAGLDADELILYATQDTEGGCDTGYRNFSISSSEGRFLYALIRALKPLISLEIGVFDGVSSLHLLSALEANENGVLISYDIDPESGHLVAGHERWEQRIEDAAKAELPPAEFVFEDADHGLESATAILTKLKALNARVVISHDYYSHEVYGDGFYVKQAFDSVFGEENVIGIRFEGGERGFGLWFNPEWKVNEYHWTLADDTLASSESETTSVTVKPKPTKRKLAAKKGVKRAS